MVLFNIKENEPYLVTQITVAAVSEPEANQRRQLFILEKVKGKIKGARNCCYARMEKLAFTVFHVFSYPALKDARS